MAVPRKKTLPMWAMLGLLAFASPALAAKPSVRSAADGVFVAFSRHPLVGIGDVHGLAQEGVFYRRLVRDPRFAAQVGNLVVEAADAAQQATLDRYVDGARIPRAELRRVWSDVVGWAPTVTSLIYPQLFAEVRAVNRRLPPARRIRVWAGEPPIDWTKIKTAGQLSPYLMDRDRYPAQILDEQILKRGKKALVIYGGYHFAALPTPPHQPSSPGLKGLVEQRHPGAFYIIQPYVGFVQPACSTAFEARTHWSPFSLVAPIKDTYVESLLMHPGCFVFEPPKPPSGAPAIAPDVLVRIQAPFIRASSGADADALLYLAPASKLTRSPDDAELVTDSRYAAEITRRLPILGLPQDLRSGIVLKATPFRSSLP